MPLTNTDAGLGTPWSVEQRHALQTLAADLDAYRHSLAATVEAVRWESTSADVLRRLARDLLDQMRVTSYQLLALL